LTDEPGDLFGPAAPELRAVEQRLGQSVAGDPAVVGRPMADLFQAGGKRIRPALVVLAAMCGRYDRERVLPAAMAVEVVHAATLVHDDVIDRSPTRRGRPSVAAALGDAPAIVVGDFYFAKAYELAALSSSHEVVAILARAVKEICAGEVRQQAIRYRYSTDRSEYDDRIEAKTATLVAACCDIGGLLGGLGRAPRDALREYGRHAGIAFQIADDVLDYTGSPDAIGKPTGHDILEGFATLPFMRAGVRLEDGRKLTDEEARGVVEEVRTSDGPKRALEEAHRHAQQARDHLAMLSGSDARAALASLADYVVTRKL
jgi:geranylgeranyl pyrophosphate synthase